MTSWWKNSKHPDVTKEKQATQSPLSPTDDIITGGPRRANWRPFMRLRVTQRCHGDVSRQSNHFKQCFKPRTIWKFPVPCPGWTCSGRACSPGWRRGPHRHLWSAPPAPRGHGGSSSRCTGYEKAPAINQKDAIIISAIKTNRGWQKKTLMLLLWFISCLRALSWFPRMPFLSCSCFSSSVRDEWAWPPLLSFLLLNNDWLGVSQQEAATF